MRQASANRRGAGRAPTVALFPFLAVLICTMGALIVVLVVLARQARNQATQLAAAKTAEAETERTNVCQMARWRITEISAAREKTEGQLRDARARLGLVEDHTRRLRDQLATAQSQDRDRTTERASRGVTRRESEGDLKRLEAEIAEARRRADAGRREAAVRPKSYAIVPYVGPNGTRRRPIYLECRSRSITLQPEGIEFSEEDLRPPLGPDNPLASALRAAREYLVAKQRLDPQKEEPYPLLVVRPDGIPAFYAAREAMKSWGSEFGYELVAADLRVSYPSPDSSLASALDATVRRARAERRELDYLTAMASADRPRATYRATPAGIVRESGRYSGSGFGSVPPVSGPGESGRPAEPPPRSGEPPAPRPEGVLPSRPTEPPPSNPPDGEKIVRRPGEWIEYQRPPRLRPEELKKKDDPKPKSLAETRGRDWGLPDATRGSVPVTRPIRVECSSERLVVLCGSGRAPEQIIVWERRTEDSIDQLVSAVWEHMKPWGIAGRKMYWRPVLRVQVAPGGETRFQELAALLEGSGLEVERAGDHETH